eukprot:1159251-Pelagomonas_calceolata.AAC.9
MHSSLEGSHSLPVYIVHAAHIRTLPHPKTLLILSPSATENLGACTAPFCSYTHFQSTLSVLHIFTPDLSPPYSTSSVPKGDMVRPLRRAGTLRVYDMCAHVVCVCDAHRTAPALCPR